MNSPSPSIQIDVNTRFLPDQSTPEQNRYAFAYTITITNKGRAPAQLVSRHWLITHGNGKIDEVRGPGVVGETPRLMPGEAFEYTSGAILEAPVGTMEGSYQMVTDEGDQFDAPIKRFVLSMPRVLH
ncbi:Co2+/Mg2+ efflux protein ApaG [Ahniella affigens]|uniref:Protein ApaG n=1 Tax=Ahniella affigens TaxID=2021234 RepID=A0A2P1PP25_9GAMM|nr:Co2+/Mg2+ efflux protein ApaG [Ahniella affigens]AVP96599.1 Co2+/Mg2+ efflux protein ApaG [Ahniella affigens]